MATSRRKTLEQRFFGGGAKRILSIDGGGMRGLVTIGILSEIERRLARRSGRDDFRLCEYFDLIGGGSTGSILAALLAMGMSCAEAAEFYREIAPPPAAGKGKAAGLRRARFDQPKLEAALARVMGDLDLSSPALRTGFAAIVKPIDAGAVWTFSNNPRARFWEAGEGGTTPQKNLLLKRVVQASAGAPALFEEVRVRLAREGGLVTPAEGVFVDGAVAGLNNPSLHLLKVATLDSYGFAWPTGDAQLFMLSVGAGAWRPRADEKTFAGSAVDEIGPTAARAVAGLKSMVLDTSLAAVATLQALSRSAKPWVVDAEVGDMRADHLSPFPVLAYQRMDATLDRSALQQLALDLNDLEIAQMREPLGDDAPTLARLYDVGARTGQSYFRSAATKDAQDWDATLLPPRFDPTFFHERAPGSPKTRLDAMGRLFERPPGPGD